MTPERLRQIDDLFQAALACAPHERQDLLERHSGDDHELRSEVESLLGVQAEAPDFLEDPILGGVSRIVDRAVEPDPEQAVGQKIGPYRLTRLIAAGGMGTVYLAERADDQYHKQVAIKLIRPGLDDPEAGMDGLRRRFRTERQVLATLDHPFVARLLDGGSTPDGRLYYVMEYVDGQPVDTFVDQMQLGRPQRLQLIARICAAVQYAHQKGVIHRDLKPSNILVLEDGTPKLLDFGLAKPIESTMWGESAAVTMDAAFMGTFAYAAPEQINARQGVDTRSDVYSLGVLLFRLMTHTHPYALTGSVTEMLERISEAVVPRPSSVDRSLGDELDTIILKSLAREQDRRYASAGDLKQDIERYLNGQPIMAKADSHWYVLRKTARRYRVPLVMSVVVMVLITVFAAVLAVQLRTTQRAERRAADSAATLTRALRVSNIERGRTMAASGNTTLGENLIWSELLDLEGQEAFDAGDRRLAYWALWELYQHAPCEVSLPELTSQITEVRFVPDGQQLVVGLRNGNVQVWDVSGRQQVADVAVHNTPIYGMAVDAQGRRIAAGGDPPTIHVWELNGGRRTSSVHPRGDRICDIQFMKERDVLASSSNAGVQLWDLASNREIAILDPTAAQGTGRIHITEDDGWIAACCRDDHVRAWSTTTGAVELEVQLGAAGNKVAISSDKRYLAIGHNAPAMSVYDIVDDQWVASFEQLRGWIQGVAFNPARPEILAASTSDRMVRLYRLPSGTLEQTIAQERGAVSAMAFAADGTRIATGGSDKSLRVWETKPVGCVRRIVGHQGTVFSIAMDPVSPRFATCGGFNDPTIRMWSLPDGRLLNVMRGHTDTTSKVQFSPDGSAIVSSSYDGTVRVWDPDDGDCTATLTGHSGSINSLSFQADGKRFATAGEDGTVLIWDFASREVIKVFDQGSARVPSVSMAPDGHFAVSTSAYDQVVVMWDTISGQRRDLSGHVVSSRAALFAPHGRLFVSTGDDHIVRLWSCEPDTIGQRIAELSGHKQDVFAAAFTPDSTVLATAGRGGSILLWDVEQHRLLASLEGHNDMVFSLAIGPRGRWLVSGGRDRVIGLWDLQYYDRHIAGNRSYHASRQKP